MTDEVDGALMRGQRGVLIWLRDALRESRNGGQRESKGKPHKVSSTEIELDGSSWPGWIITDNEIIPRLQLRKLQPWLEGCQSLTRIMEIVSCFMTSGSCACGAGKWLECHCVAEVIRKFQSHEVLSGYGGDS
jgi:hypothetical protein